MPHAAPPDDIEGMCVPIAAWGVGVGCPGGLVGVGEGASDPLSLEGRGLGRGWTGGVERGPAEVSVGVGEGCVACPGGPANV